MCALADELDWKPVARGERLALTATGRDGVVVDDAEQLRRGAGRRRDLVGELVTAESLEVGDGDRVADLLPLLVAVRAEIERRDGDVAQPAEDSCRRLGRNAFR
jgi:hypothetical protein